MKTFPMFLAMTDREVVIVGGGEQAAQKCRLVLKTDARIKILAQRLDPELQTLADQGQIIWCDEAVAPEVFCNATLVFVATGCPGLDASIHDLAKLSGALVNVVDQPALCDAITPSIVDREPVVVAIGTEGTAPVLGRQIKTQIEELLEPRLGELASMAGRLRGLAAHRLRPKKRRDLWKWVFSGPIRTKFRAGQETQAARDLKTAITTGAFAEAAPAPVALVGAGPGSRDLITLRGVQRLQEADVVFYDRLIDPDILELARRDAERVYVGKAPGCHSWPQSRINDFLVAAAKRGQRVVRLKCGDPGIFARGAEEAEALQAAGIRYEIVPGVTAASAAAATAGTFLTERGKTDTLVLSTGTNLNGQANTAWASHLRSGSQIAIYMGAHATRDIERKLQTLGLSKEVEVTIVANAERANARVVRCNGETITKAMTSAQITNPAILFLRRDTSDTLPISQNLTKEPSDWHQAPAILWACESRKTDLESEASRGRFVRGL